MEQRVEKKSKHDNSFKNSIDNIKEMATNFKDKYHKTKNNEKY